MQSADNRSTKCLVDRPAGKKIFAKMDKVPLVFIVDLSQLLIYSHYVLFFHENL